jgi:hypothetical protein
VGVAMRCPCVVMACMGVGMGMVGIRHVRNLHTAGCHKTFVAKCHILLAQRVRSWHPIGPRTGLVQPQQEDKRHEQQPHACDSERLQSSQRHQRPCEQGQPDRGRRCQGIIDAEHAAAFLRLCRVGKQGDHGDIHTGPAETDQECAGGHYPVSGR